jgi:glycosyltransferase involved in cell wall biosynthesis
MRIAAIVVSLPERHYLLKECLDSVAWQTREPDDILVGVDWRHYGEVGNANRLIDATDCDWLAFCHDDDLWDRDHLEVAESFFDQGDVIVARFRLDGRPVWTMEPWHEDFEDLRFTNWIASPSMVVARREVFGHFVGPRPGFRWVDWSQWNHLLDQGARFVDTKQVTTTARYGPWENGSCRA